MQADLANGDASRKAMLNIATRLTAPILIAGLVVQLAIASFIRNWQGVWIDVTENAVRNIVRGGIGIGQVHVPERARFWRKYKQHLQYVARPASGPLPIGGSPLHVLADRNRRLA